MQSYWNALDRYGTKDPIILDQSPSGTLIRRLAVIHDVEGKTRVIGICDYWTQSVLRNLHFSILDILKTIPGDCTYDQTSRLGKIVARDSFYSMDLTSATDRFPVEVQEYILGHLYGRTPAAAWKRILTKWEFNIQGETYRYAVGQPMGAYSSWAAFALSHHLIVRVAAMRAGFNPWSYDNYMLLGDDLVLGDDQVASHYKAILDTLDVPISKTKTHVSKDTYEFAKRWWHKGKDISGAPLQSLRKGALRRNILYGFLPLSSEGELEYHS